MKKIFLITTLFALAACSFDQDKAGSSNQTKKIAEQNAQTSATFGKIAGLYSGALRTANGDQNIQINLSTLAVSDGTTNPDGTARIRITPAASYIKVSPVGAPLVNFSITYIPETGDLTLVNDDQKSKKDIDEVNTIFAKIVGDRLTGVVKSAAKDIGTFELRLTANGSATPPNGAQEEYNDRLRKQYSDLAGSYVGCVTTTEGGSLTKPYTAKMTLSLYEDSTSTGESLPRLAGNFHRDTDKTDGTDTALSATYRPDLSPATLTILGKPYITNNGYVSTFAGTYTNGEFAGTFTSNKKGLEGNIFLKKGTAYPSACSDVAK